MSLLRASACSLLLAGCLPPSPGGLTPQRECIPDWPEECLGEPSTTGDDPGPLECPDAPPLEDDERTVYGCFPRPEGGECPEATSRCVSDAAQRRYVVDCRDCLREDVEVDCGPDPGVSEACCYVVRLREPATDDCD